MTGQIIEGRGGLYTVVDEAGDTQVLRAMKKLRRQGVSPLVGDWVEMSPGEGDQHGWITAIRPRDSVFVRPPVANVSLMVLVMAPVPEPDLMVIDRMLLTAALQQIKVLLVVNKSDLDPALITRIAADYQAHELQVLSASALTGEGVEAIRAALKGHLAFFAGPSGVGKSALISRLTGKDLEQGAISEKLGRGRHTTRHVSLLSADGFSVLDTPGFSFLTMDESLPPEELAQAMLPYRAYQGQCRFSPCLHDNEPDCAVKSALDKGLLSSNRHQRYLQLLREQRETWRKRYD